jgi:hypothetical protein
MIIKRGEKRKMNKSDEQQFQINPFYYEYYGHRIDHLEIMENSLRRFKGGERSLIFLGGDSSLDNKHWFTETAAAVNGYETLLTPPVSKQDVAYWLNSEILKQKLESKFAVINCAYEESSIGSRACGRLSKHDRFIRDHITSEDCLIVSVGGNDVALQPSLCTIMNILSLLCCTTNACLESSTCGTSIPCDDPCCGAGPGCLSNCCAFPPGYGYFLHLFGTRVEAYLKNLTSRQRPKKILICMIYYLDEQTTGGWADTALAALGYNSNPEKLQSLIRRIYEDATKRIKVPGTEVVAVPLFAALDGTHTEDYIQRVEPSARGGEKMAGLLMDGIVNGQPAMDAAYARVKLATGMGSSMAINRGGI